MSKEQVQYETVSPCQDRTTRDWYAWINKIPPKPDDFHVVGEIEVPNPGVFAVLTKKVPQGINPKILLLDLLLIQKPGIWPQVITSIQVRFDAIVTGNVYEEVNIFCAGDDLVRIPVEEVS